MYIGIDLGTSGVKSIAMTEQGEIIASCTVSLEVSRPKPLWSEQDPSAWWEATCESINGLKASVNLSDVIAIGLSGQMHGATLLDANGDVLRPASYGTMDAVKRNVKSLKRQCQTLVILPVIL